MCLAAGQLACGQRYGCACRPSTSRPTTRSLTSTASRRITATRSPGATRSASRHGKTARTAASTGARSSGRSTTRMPGSSRCLWCGHWTVSPREGAKGALRIIRQFKQRGCTVVSVKESWLNAAPEVQDVLVAFAGWMAHEGSRRRSDRIRAGVERRRAEGKPVGRQPGARDKAPRKRAGSVASRESGKRRAAHDARTAS